jgi:hypothetical protein
MILLDFVKVPDVGIFETDMGRPVVFVVSPLDPHWTVHMSHVSGTLNRQTGFHNKEYRRLTAFWGKVVLGADLLLLALDFLVAAL